MTPRRLRPVRPPHRVCISGQPNCGFTANQVFECGTCHEIVCYCQGGKDETPDACADCFCDYLKAHHA